jgi:hypothetical protein
MTSQSPIKEDFIHFVWRTKRVPNELTTVDGRRIKVLDYGTYNLNSGPDFFNGKVEIDGTIWAGNIEMHVFTRDWIKHKHQNDRAYDNVILHVVYEHDGDLPDNNLPTVELKGLIPKIVLDRYLTMMSANNTSIPCHKLISKVDLSKINLWKNALLIDRISQKSNYIAKLHNQSMSSWEDATYIAVAKYFGSKVNVEPFERLAKSIPLSIFHKNKDKPISVEALVWGQAGMLVGNHKDPYFLALQSEYRFLKQKYSLEPMDPLTWKFGKLRPINFPTVRLAQFAALMSKVTFLFSRAIEAKTVKDLRTLFRVKPHEYWDTHYRFDVESRVYDKTISNGFIDLILINAIIPIVFQYGKSIDDEEMTDRAIAWLEDIKSEVNTITNMWSELGVELKTSYDSQAMIQLKTMYCDQFRCLECKIGNEIFNFVPEKDH